MKLKPLDKFSPELFVPVARAAIWQARVDRCNLKSSTVKHIWKYRSWVMDDMKRTSATFTVTSVQRCILTHSEYVKFETAWDDLRSVLGELKCYDLRMMDLLPIAEVTDYSIHNSIPVELQRSTLTVGQLFERNMLPDMQGVWGKISSVLHEPTNAQNAEPLSESCNDKVDTLKAKIVDMESELDKCKQDVSAMKGYNREYENMLRAEREASAKLRGREDQYKQDISILEEHNREYDKLLSTEREANAKLRGIQEAYENMRMCIFDADDTIDQLKKALALAEKERQETENTCSSVIQLNDKLKSMLKAIIDIM